MINKKRCLVCTAAVIAMVFFGMVILGKLFRPTRTDIAFQQIEVFHSLPENSLDVIIYGSSHAWRSVMPMQMYDEYGIGAYNYGAFWQKLNTTYVFLNDSLDTQKPKVALIEVGFVNKQVENEDLIGASCIV